MNVLSHFVVLRILQDGYERFRTDMDAGAIAQALMEKGVISKNLLKAITNSRSEEERSDFLYEDLFRYGTQDSLRTVCEVAVTGGSQKMVEVGQSMVEELERGLLNLNVK